MRRRRDDEAFDDPCDLLVVREETARPAVDHGRLPAVVPSGGELEAMPGEEHVRPPCRPEEADVTRWDLTVWWLYVAGTFAVARVAWFVIVAAMERKRKP